MGRIYSDFPISAAIARMSPTTELAVGNSPAPGPERVMLPTGCPLSDTAFVT